MKRRLLFLAYVNSWDFFHSGMLMKNVITQFGKKSATEIVTTRLKICYHKAASNLAIL